MWSDQEKKIQKIDRLARSLLIQSLLNDIYSLIDSNKTAKDLWDAIVRKMLGSEYGEQDRKAVFLYEYETFKATKGELCLILTFQPEWKQYATMMRQNKNLMDINIDALYNILKKNQGDVNDAMGLKKKTVVVTSDPLALIAEKSKASKRKEKVVVLLILKEVMVMILKFYAKPINNNLRTSSATSSANKKQEYVKTDDKKDEMKVDEKKRDTSKTKMLLAKKDKDEQVLLAEDLSWMESSSDLDQEIIANMVFMAQIENVLSDSEASSSSSDDKIAEVSYYTSESESESEYETSEYYDNSTTYALYVDNNDDQEIFHDSSEQIYENIIEYQIDHNESYVTHNDSEETAKLINQMIKEFDKKIAKYQKRLEKANQQCNEFENQNKDLKYKYDVLKNQSTTFEEKNNGLNEQIKVLIKKNDDLLAQTNILKEQLKVKHVVIDTHVECQTKYAKLEAKIYEYMIRYFVYFDNDKQHRKQIDDQEILFDKMSYHKRLETYAYDEKVIGLGYTSRFLTHSNESLEIEKFKRTRENKIEFAYDYRNLNASYVNEKINLSDDYFQKIINQDFDKNDSSFQQTSSLKLYVPTVILEKIIIDLEDEVVSLLEKEKETLETIESLKPKGFESSEKEISKSENQSENDCQVVENVCDDLENPNVIAPEIFMLSVSQSDSPIFVTKTSCASNSVETKLKRKRRKRTSSKHNVNQVNSVVLRANTDFVHFLDLDAFSSVRRPKSSDVIWQKKGSSNTVKANLSSINHSNLNKNVKQYSRKDLMLCNNSHLRDTRSAHACNNARNAYCNATMNAYDDVNDLFVFDDVRNGESILDSRCSKHMTGNRALLTNFVEKFLGTVRFGNNNFTVIAGYGDVIIGSMTIKRVYCVEGLGHNLFSVGQFCDKGLEIAFRKSTCFVRNENGVDLLTSDRLLNLYTIALNEIASNSLDCLLANAPSSQSWLWHQRLSHLNFAIINNLVKNNLVRNLPKMKFEKDHLCSACEQGKIHQKHHKSKTDFASNQPLYLLHMDLCGPMRVESINGKLYVLVVVDDFSRYTWVLFLHSKDEASEVGISQKFSAARTSQQNGVMERKNQTLVEAARTLLTFANLPLFIWVEAIATACFTQNRSTIHTRFDKTPYELISKRKPNFKFFYVFGYRCYLLNHYDDVGYIKAKWDIGVFVGYSKDSAAFRIYNKRTRDSRECESSSSHNVFNERLEDAYFDASTAFHDTSDVHTYYQPYPHETKWTKNHSLHKIIGDPNSSDVYVAQPSGFVSKQYPDHVYALVKALYGLKQAPRAWYDVLSTFLIDSGFQKAESEYVVVLGCCAQVLWMRTQLMDYGFFFDKVPIYYDSRSAIAISCNPVQHTRTKHIDLSQMHNNIMAAGSRDRPPMLAPGRYPQWRSWFLRYVDTRPNGEALRKCIMSGPYKPTTVLVQAVEATDNSPAVPEHTTVETPTNMSPENKAHFLAEKEAIHLKLTGIGDDIYSTVDDCQTAQKIWDAIERLQEGEFLNIQDVKTNLFWEFGKFTSHDGETMESYYTRFYKLMNEMIRNNLTVTTMQVNVQFLQQLQLEWLRFVTIIKQQHKLNEVSYHKLFDILKQYQNEVKELRAEKLARNANPLALVATAQASQDPFYQSSRSHRSQAPSSKPSIPSKSHTSTRHKGKEIAKPITPLSETASEEDIDPEQAQRDKDMQKNLALIAKYFKKIYKPTNNNLRTSSNSKNKNVDTTLWYKNDDHYGQFATQKTVNVAGTREKVGSQVVQQSGIQCFNCKEYGHFAKPKRVKDSTYHKEKMLLCKQAEQGVSLQAEQYDWLADTDEEVDEQELEAHYSYMAKIQEQTESVSNTCLVETDDSNVTPDSPDMCEDDIQNDQNDVESDDEWVALANLKLDVDENKKIQNQLKKANTTLAQELKECKAILAKTSKSLGESISVRDSCLVALQTKQAEFEKYKAFNDRTVYYDKLECKLNEALGQLAHKDTVIRQGLKTKAYELLVVKEKHDELMKHSLLTKSHYEGLVKQKTKVITDLKLREEHDIEKILSMEKQLKFLNEVVYKRSQSIHTIHMMSPKVSTYNGRPTFANPRYLKQAQSEIPCLYAFPYDQNSHANRLIPDREETLALERESRSKLNK
nr:hypothetical protein [Tanacetum cinerariifolium]